MGAAIRTGTHERGLTLIELMIAITLGMIISGSILTVYVNTSRNFALDGSHARMQENARYALRVLGEDLVMADFWGQVISTDTITTALAPTPGDCGDAPSLFVPDTALLFNNYHESPPVAQFAPCATVTANRQGDSDVLVIKRVAGTPTASVFVDTADTDGDGNTTEVLSVGTGSLVNEMVYLRTNGTTGSLIDDAAPANPPTVGWADWRYIPRLYFVRDFFVAAGDNTPTLCRLDLDDDDLDDLMCVAEGIEDLHLEFGIDTDIDGDPDFYTAIPTAAEMPAAVTARIHVLARSLEQIPFYTNSKAYQLGDKAIAAINDGFIRKVFSTTVALRNSAQRNVFN
jgi:type IV pilus assembly protein PilW